MPRIRRTPQSKVDALNIWLSVAEHGISAADKLAQSLDATYDLIARFPGTGTSRDRWAKGLRSVPCGNYVVFFQKKGAFVEILRVLHGAQNQKKYFRKRL